MPRTRNHPRRSKCCVFCHYWMGDAELKYVSPSVGFEYERDARGKCMKKDLSFFTYASCNMFSPSIEASKLL